MATTKPRTTPRTTKSRSTPQRKADTGLLARTGRTVQQRPYVSAAIATGAVTAVAAAAAGAFFLSRRDKTLGETASDLSARVKDGFAEASERIRDRFAKDKPQSDIAEEALTLKETGKRDNRPTDPLVEDQLKAGAVI